MRKYVVLASVGLMAVAGLAVTGCMNVQAKLQEAAAAASKGNWQQGYEITQKCLKKEKTNVSALVLNGFCLFELGRSDEALAMLEQGATQAPDNFAAQYFYGWILSESGRYADALVPLRRAHQLRPNHQDLLILLSRCCIEQNLPEGARYLQALRRFPNMENRPELYNALGVLWLNQGQLELAKRQFMVAWAKDNSNLIAPQNLAVMFDQYMHNPTEALRHYRFCLDANQRSGDQLRAAKINDRIQQLSKEVPKNLQTTATGGTTGAAAGTGTAGTTGAKTGNKPEVKGGAKAGGKASATGKSAAGKTATKSGKSTKPPTKH